MSDSHKARFGTLCKWWKDTVLCSRNQKRAWSSRKRIETRIRRRRESRQLESELVGELDALQEGGTDG